MAAVSYCRSPVEIADDMRLAILAEFPGESLDYLLELSHNQLVSRRYALERKRIEKENAQDRLRFLRSFAPERPFYNGSIY
jgi:hypothetical protein